MMTTLVSNPSGGGRGGTTKPSRENNNRKSHHQHQINKSSSTNSNNATASHLSNATAGGGANSINETAPNQTEEFRNKTDKFQPTAEQMRIASLMSDKKDDDLKPKIEKIVELTGASREDAAVALYDCDNDMPKAIEMILDGESFDSEWQSTGRKKKTKGQANQIGDGSVMTNGAAGNNKSDKSTRSNKNNSGGGAGGGGTQSKRSGKPPGQANRKRGESRNNNENNNRVDTEDGGESGGMFVSGNSDQQNRKSNAGGERGKRGAPRGRAPRGKGVARGSRTFMNRGIQNNNSNASSGNNNDGFPNSIETWSNNAAEPSKPVNDLNTMTVGNWSDVAAGHEDWCDEDWSTQPMETKVFTPSTKVIPEKDELKEQKSHNHDSAPAYLSSVKNEESSQPTMSAIISNNIQRPTATAGQALLQQIQQQSSGVVPQNSSISPYDLNRQFDTKRATESIKSLVGINPMSGEHSLENLSKPPQQTSNQNRMKQVQSSAAAAQPSKIPESAVEMPSANDRGVANLTLHFGSLDFGTNNFPSGSNDPSLFDQVNPNASKKPENKTNLTLLSTNAASDGQYRGSNSSAGGSNTNKNMLQGQVLPHALNESMLNNHDHRNDKSLNANSYHASKTIERKTDYIGQLSHQKSVYAPQNAGDNVYPNYQALASAANVGYYSNSNQVQFGTSNPAVMNATAALISGQYNSAYNNANNAQKIRDMDNNVQNQPNQVVNVSSSPSGAKSYETSGNQPAAGMVSMMSSTTSTTNAIKNTVPSTKGIHNVPPGVNNSVQTAQVINPYLVGNPGMAIPYHHAYAAPYDLQYSATPRDHTGYSYPGADVKYNRNTESDILPVSSHQAANAVQTATQAHNYFPPGYPYAFAYASFAQGMYGATQPAMYPVPQAAQNTASGNSGFGKPNTAANYGSHNYNNSAYESLGTGTGVPQSQDYVNKPYQQHKQMAGTNAVGGDMSAGNPANMYSKAHPQLNKTYDKQGFQAQAPQMGLTTPAAAAQTAGANLSSAYSNAYMLPHQQPMHAFTTGVEHTGGQQQASAGAGGLPNQRTLTQTHKSGGQSNPVGGGGAGGHYGKFNNWN